jgi:phosphatidylserine decarboxylase
MKFLKWLLITVIIFVGLIFAYYQLWFLRKPDRNIPNNNTVFVSPANGVVVSVKKWDGAMLKELKGELGVVNVWTKDVDTAGTVISIQMDPTHVHFQRAPVAGRVVSEKYNRGSFNNAIVMSNEYGIRFENEHNEILLETPTGKKYKVVQIAGYVARRIEEYVSPGQQVKQGEVIGLIKLGSQVTVILPHDVKPMVTVGMTTIDGETVIGKERD